MTRTFQIIAVEAVPISSSRCSVWTSAGAIPVSDTSLPADATAVSGIGCITQMPGTIHITLKTIPVAHLLRAVRATPITIPIAHASAATYAGAVAGVGCITGVSLDSIRDY